MSGEEYWKIPRGDDWEILELLPVRGFCIAEEDNADGKRDIYFISYTVGDVVLDDEGYPVGKGDFRVFYSSNLEALYYALDLADLLRLNNIRFCEKPKRDDIIKSLEQYDTGGLISRLKGE